MDVKLQAFVDASASFAYLARLDMAQLQIKLQDEQLIDGLRNGCAQKFEYSMELCWKAIKVHLLHIEGVDEASPKKVIKAYYLTGDLIEVDYLLLLDALEDRNRLTHVYDNEVFKDILSRMTVYAALFERISSLLINGNAS